MIIEMYCPKCGATSDIDEDLLLSPGSIWITCKNCCAEFRVELGFYEDES